MNRENGQPFSFADPCIGRGATEGYDAHAAAEAIKAVEQFLISPGTLHLPKRLKTGLSGLRALATATFLFKNAVDKEAGHEKSPLP